MQGEQQVVCEVDPTGTPQRSHHGGSSAGMAWRQDSQTEVRRSTPSPASQTSQRGGNSASRSPRSNRAFMGGWAGVPTLSA